MVCGCGEGGLSADSACQDACGHCVMFCLPSCGIFTKYQRKQTWQDHLVLISFILRGFKCGGVCCAVVICGMMSRCGYMAWMCWWHNIYNVAMCGEVCCGVALVVLRCGRNPRGGRNVTGMCRRGGRRQGGLRQHQGSAQATAWCILVKLWRMSIVNDSYNEKNLFFGCWGKQPWLLVLRLRTSEPDHFKKSILGAS